MNDPTCNSASITPDGAAIVRTGAELYIFVDTTWAYREILPIVSYLLDNIDVNPYGTFFTIMNAMDGNVLVSRTQSLADMHTNWTLDSQQTRKLKIKTKRNVNKLISINFYRPSRFEFTKCSSNNNSTLNSITESRKK